MEVLGPNLHSCWIRLVGIPLHAWSEEVFNQVGSCIGQVLEFDEDAKLMSRFDGVRLKILRDLQRELPKFVALEVEGVRFRRSCSGSIGGNSGWNLLRFVGWLLMMLWSPKSQFLHRNSWKSKPQWHESCNQQDFRVRQGYQE